MDTLTLRPDGSIRLPREVRDRLGDPSEWAVFMKKDTIILKRLAPVKLSHIAERLPASGPPLQEIAADVRHFRRGRRRGRG
jgi:hypothetical protein